ncbi:MAG: hypothetical protein Q8K34_04810 [Hydrogenophaga sp.]|uniref:hypothetical protein n=1 Tax=Hydrogenophaga sp. TaxID=1904254 RepID=UPI00277AC5C9|nr:hypothetical protein [Hydrogenophaga sp.]MDP1895717.1 hypothetical protein [Hydrogenophaga sp.]MDP2219509.1 hypothetical protein [Hydrogenophaga sp.]MDZ4280629.1 hypothetical protein [Hydrogenophaga sp.]
MKHVLSAVVCIGLSTIFTQVGAQDTTPLNPDEATTLIKGKRLETNNARFGSVGLDLRDGGRLYGNNQGSSDSGEWRLEDNKLCLKWRRWDYDGCGVLQRRGDKVEHLYPDGTLHFTFTPK